MLLNLNPMTPNSCPRIEGDYLWGRGAADMKTVVATYMVWMKDMMKVGTPFPNISLLLVGNEENGEAEAWGTPFVLKELDLETIAIHCRRADRRKRERTLRRNLRGESRCDAL